MRPWEEIEVARKKIRKAIRQTSTAYKELKCFAPCFNTGAGFTNPLFKCRISRGEESRMILEQERGKA